MSFCIVRQPLRAAINRLTRTAPIRFIGEWDIKDLTQVSRAWIWYRDYRIRVTVKNEDNRWNGVAPLRATVEDTDELNRNLDQLNEASRLDIIHLTAVETDWVPKATEANAVWRCRPFHCMVSCADLPGPMPLGGSLAQAKKILGFVMQTVCILPGLRCITFEYISTSWTCEILYDLLVNSYPIELSNGRVYESIPTQTITISYNIKVIPHPMKDVQDALPIPSVLSELVHSYL